MKKLFVVGGMGAGKSSVVKVLAEKGLPVIDLDKVGHEVLHLDVVKEELREAFGDTIFDDKGEVVRAQLAKLAFATPADTRKLNRISMPRIEDAFLTKTDELERQGYSAVVVEYSVFKNREMSLAYQADVVIAVLAPVEMRVARAVAAGWPEEDVRARIARQITDVERAELADISFINDKSKDELRAEVETWWGKYCVAL